MTCKAPKVKTPITYYGGKQQLTDKILPLIQPHKIYCEPFCGGAAIFFAKEPSDCEVINDTNGELINFYEITRREFSSLEQEIAISLHSRKKHRHAQVIYETPELFTPVQRAWAVWMLANTSYGSKLDGAFGYDRTGKTSQRLNRKRSSFCTNYAIRLQNTQIECCDALRIINSRDTESTFFYLDPPYVGADQGHYDGYTQDDFDHLLDTLSKIKGKFLLSSYRNTALASSTAIHSWHTLEFKMACSMSRGGKTQKQKIEVLTANYPINIS